MSRKGNKLAATSRFRVIPNEHSRHISNNITIDHVRYKTEESENTIFPIETKQRDLQKSLTCRKDINMSLETLVRNGSKMRKVCLEKIAGHYKPIIKPVLLEPRQCLSKQDKENVRRSILEAINETPRRKPKHTQHY